ncbi:hypothetical protein ACN4EG_05875 [Alkalinema pantanalense CENA528]|uniref:hypothetical protein n=1 Tax=Alkalinema pantanalense TaxID=1620705 RepID=UPI003D6FEFC5
MNLRFAIACFLVVFGMVEGFQWLKHLTIPFPIFILGGIVLAVISNYDKLPMDWLQILRQPRSADSTQPKDSES